MAEGKPVIDVDGSYLYRKQQKQTTEITATALPCEPLAGWESITADNCEEMAKRIPPVMPGIHIALWLYVILLYSQDYYIPTWQKVLETSQLVMGHSVHFNVDTITGHLAV